jgi:hypothetical protein
VDWFDVGDAACVDGAVTVHPDVGVLRPAGAVHQAVPARVDFQPDRDRSRRRHTAAFLPPYFPEGEIAAKTRETGMQALLAAVIAPVFGTDFLMRIKISMRYWKSKGHHEL